jgi:hypothetical protein
MNNDWDQLLAALATGLRTQVAPHLATEQARIQLNAVVYALDNVRLQGSWSSAVLLEHVRAQQHFFATIESMFAHRATEFPGAGSGVLDVMQLRDRGDEAINAFIDRQYEVPVPERDGNWHQARLALVEHLRATLAIDRRRTAKSMMHELSGPGSEQLA